MSRGITTLAWWASFTSINRTTLMTDRCTWCGQLARMEFVRGYYECSVRHLPIIDAQEPPSA
jgi:hypothetical protein